LIVKNFKKQDERRGRLIEYLKKTYNITKLPNPQEIELVKGNNFDYKKTITFVFRFHELMMKRK